MRLMDEHIDRICAEHEIWNELLCLDKANILELGCGTADLTRQIAGSGKACKVTAMEVDAIQHAKNLQIADVPNVRFVFGGAEAIPAADDSFDVVLMFKSLHHVPMEHLDRAMSEIGRVLKPNGRAYISEPIFTGDFNEILRQFHDEEAVRCAAFAAIKHAVADGRFTLLAERFFLSPMYFVDFAAFEAKVIGVSHAQHQLSEAVYASVRQDFNKAMREDGAHFLMPMRVDLLKAVA